MKANTMLVVPIGKPPNIMVTKRTELAVHLS